MNIQPVTYNACAPAFGGKTGSSKKFIDRAVQYVMDKLPEFTTKDSAALRETLQKIDKTISRPDVNRLIMGGTAILTQPLIDYNNHKVDKETRTVARNRTIAKIIAGTGVGVGVRGLCYWLIGKMTQINGTGKLSKALLPEKLIDSLAKNTQFLNNHRNALSTGIALIVMLFTNFLLDAPLTTWLTNKFNAKTQAKQDALKQQQAQTHQMQQIQQLQQMQTAQEGRFIAYA